jgi:hydroxypyruvate isomerase
VQSHGYYTFLNASNDKQYMTTDLDIEVLEAIEGINKELNDNQYSLLMEALNTLVMPSTPLPLDNVKNATNVYDYIIKTVQLQLPYFNLYITEEQEAGIHELIHENIEKIKKDYQYYLYF